MKITWYKLEPLRNEGAREPLQPKNLHEPSDGTVSKAPCYEPKPLASWNKLEPTLRGTYLPHTHGGNDDVNSKRIPSNGNDLET